MKEYSVKLTLKSLYHWGKNNEHSNSQGIVHTRCNGFNIGDIVTFESLAPYSWVGDLNTNHYHFFEGRTYKCVPCKTTPRQKWFNDYEFQEV